jgi:hypothetical protein
LHAGDKLNPVTRVATVSAVLPPGAHKEISLTRETLASYVGTYQIQPGVYMFITLEGGQLISQLTGQGKVPLFAEAEDKFYPKLYDAPLEFVKDGNGTVTKLIFGKASMERLDDAAVKRLADESAAKLAAAQQRYRDQKPAPEAEAALRRYIASLQLGESAGAQMSPAMGQPTREQLPLNKGRFAMLGSLQSIAFKSVKPNGWDVYEVKCEHGSLKAGILLASDGRIEGLIFLPQ